MEDDISNNLLRLFWLIYHYPQWKVTGRNNPPPLQKSDVYLERKVVRKHILAGVITEEAAVVTIFVIATFFKLISNKDSSLTEQELSLASATPG